MITCEKCSMEATHTFIDKEGLVHTYCEHHAPKGSVKRGEVKKESIVKTYKPLFFATALVLLYVLLRAFGGGRTSLHQNIEDIMGGYFLVFGLLQALSGTRFADVFKKYDPIAERFPIYAQMYPYMLLFFGFMHHVNKLVVPIAFVTIVIFSIQTVGIWKVLKRGEHIQCACIGTKFSLPLSRVTIVENLLMIIFAVATLSFRLIS